MLNKETLVSLQEKQIYAVLDGETIMYTNIDPQYSLETSLCEDSCCRKSCRKQEEL
jgi:hypothetical protein